MPQAPRCPLLDPQAQAGPGPRLPRARKLARPQRLPFIASFPLSAVPPRTWAEQVSSTLSPRHVPHKPGWVQVSNSAGTPFFDPGVLAPRPQFGWGARPRGNPALVAPIHPSLCRASSSMGKGGSPRGRGEWDRALPGLSETEGAEPACFRVLEPAAGQTAGIPGQKRGGL